MPTARRNVKEALECAKHCALAMKSAGLSGASIQLGADWEIEELKELASLLGISVGEQDYARMPEFSGSRSGRIYFVKFYSHDIRVDAQGFVAYEDESDHG